jgi:hypothetical protein
MSVRENWLRTVLFGWPERIAGDVCVRQDGWHKYGKRLNDLFEEYNGVRPYEDDGIPSPDPGTVNERGEYHKVWTDEW